MAFEKRFKTDPIFVKNAQDIINALFFGENPFKFLKAEATKEDFIKHLAGEQYTSFDDFTRSLKSNKKRADKKEKVAEFLKEHEITMYPHSAYSIFLNEKKKEYETKNPGESSKVIRELMTKDWTGMTDKKKEVFENIYHKLKQEFIDKVKEIDPSYIIYFDKSQAPKANPSPYNSFVSQQMKKIKEENSELNSTEIMRLAAEKWKNLSENDKKAIYEKCGVEYNTSKSKSVKSKPTKAVVDDKTKSESEDEKPKGKSAPKAAAAKATPAKKGMTKSDSEATSDLDSESESKNKKAPVKKPAASAKPAQKSKGKSLDNILDDEDD
jgi:hypothetical protein